MTQQPSPFGFLLKQVVISSLVTLPIVLLFSLFYDERTDLTTFTSLAAWVLIVSYYLGYPLLFQAISK